MMTIPRTASPAILRTFLLVAFVLAGLAGRVLAQQRPTMYGSIHGQVRLASGRRVESVFKVSISQANTPIMSAYTDERGEFEFRDLEGMKTYDLRIEAASEDNPYEVSNEKVDLERNVQNVTIYVRLKGDLGRRGDVLVAAEDFDGRAPSGARKEYDKAEKSIKSGELPKGIEHLNRSLAIYPDYLMARNELGVVYMRLNQLPDAAGQFQRVLDRQDKYYNARFNLGLVRLQQKMYKQALEELSKAVSIDSSQSSSHLWLGVAMLETGNLPGAAGELARAIGLGGQGSAAAHYYLAIVHVRRGAVADACRELKTFLDQSPAGDLAVDAKSRLGRCPREGK